MTGEQGLGKSGLGGGRPGKGRPGEETTWSRRPAKLREGGEAKPPLLRWSSETDLANGWVVSSCLTNDRRVRRETSSEIDRHMEVQQLFVRNVEALFRSIASRICRFWLVNHLGLGQVLESTAGLWKTLVLHDRPWNVMFPVSLRTVKVLVQRGTPTLTYFARTCDPKACMI